MATAAQIAANRENAKSSTGPRTTEGKQNSSANATKFGLFSASNCVHAGDQDEYDQVAAGLWDNLRPATVIEEMLATEVIRCAWRLRRCATAERNLSRWVTLKQRKELVDSGAADPDRKPADPVLFEYAAPVQSAIDRARGQAQSGLRRAMNELGKHQTERLLRARILPADVDPATLGLASAKILLAADKSESSRQKEQVRAASDEFASQLIRQFQAEDLQLAATLRQFHQNEPKSAVAETLGQPRNALCACGSGVKHKRCCGLNAPPVLHAAA
jgi:hypothetical protein